MDIVGILRVSKAVSPLSRPCDPPRRDRLVNAEVIISYNGNHRDLLDLVQLTGLPAGRRIEIRGGHIEMRKICSCTTTRIRSACFAPAL